MQQDQSWFPNLTSHDLALPSGHVQQSHVACHRVGVG